MLDRESLMRELMECSDVPAVVEGRKDREALASLGFEDVVELNNGGSLLSTVESLQDCGMVSILTDLDQEGKILRKKLLKLFNLYGIAEYKKPREILANMRVQHVESLRGLQYE